MTEDTDRLWHESPEYRQEQLSAALDGMLTPDEQAALDAHLAGCESCRRELEELRQVRSLLRATPEPALPRSFLLPLEGDLPAPRTSHTPPVTSAPGAPRTPAPVTPLRSAPDREPTGVHAARTTRTSRTLQVTRWIGTIAAILGLALFIGTLLPQTTRQNSAANTSVSYGANAPTGAGAGANTTKAPSPSANLTDHGQAPQVAVTATTAVVQAPTATSAAPESAPVTHPYTVAGPSLADILRVVALVLLFAGAAVAITSLVVARRI